jgi:polyisoprenoid-binding protein YceI
MSLESQSVEYRIAPERSQVAFSVKHLMIAKVKGRFERFQGTFRLDSKQPSRSRFDGTVEVGSITTADASRDEYLRTNEFFDPKHFPEMKFSSAQVDLSARDRIRIAGTLQVKEARGPVELEVEGLSEILAHPEKLPSDFEIHARGKIDRREFGLVWPPAIEAGGVLVGNDVEIDLKFHWVRI